MEYKPAEISEFSDTTLYILWEDGHESIYLYEDLRAICPCAACRKPSGSRPFKKKIQMGGNIRPERIENVGHYAIQFYWNDRHYTGIYTFDYLRENCSCEKCKN